MALVAELVIKGTVLMGLVYGLASLLRGGSAASRHLVWLYGLTALVVLPLLTLTIPWSLPVVPAVVGSWTEAVTGSENPTAVTATTGEMSTVASTANSADRSARIERSREAGESGVAAPMVAPLNGRGWRGEAAAGSSSPWDRLPGVLLAIWLVGTILVGSRIAVGLVRLRRYASRARSLDGERWSDVVAWARERLLLDGDVRLLSSDEVAMPLTAGAVRPIVLLPGTAESWTPERRRAVLLHELAHVKRRDIVPHLMAWAACALWWFHPLAWGAARRMRAAAEQACDDLVLRVGTRPSTYADHLLEIVCAAGSTRAPAPVVPLAQRSEFEGRMLAILAPDRRRSGASSLGAVVTAAVIALCALPLAAMTPGQPANSSPGDEAALRPTTATLDAVRASVDDASSGGFEPAKEGPASESEEIEPDAPTGEPDTGRVTELAAELGVDAATLMGETPAEQPGVTTRPRDEREAAAARALAGSLADRDPEVRRVAAAALGRLQDPRSVEALSRALREDSDAGVRRAAAWALGEIEDARAIPALVDALGRDDDAQVRAAAAHALGEIESPAGVEALGAALDDPVVEVRRNAVHALGQIEAPAAVPFLVPLLRDEDVEIRRLTADALGDIESPRAVDPLIAAARDSDAEVRARVVHALGHIEDRRAAPALLRALGDEAVVVRREAVGAIGDLELTPAPPELMAAIRDPDREVRMEAVQALGDIEDPAAAPALLEIVRTGDDRELQYEALEALADMEGATPRDALIPLLEHEDPEIRKRAAKALGNRE